MIYIHLFKEDKFIRWFKKKTDLVQNVHFMVIFLSIYPIICIFFPSYLQVFHKELLVNFFLLITCVSSWLLLVKYKGQDDVTEVAVMLKMVLIVLTFIPIAIFIFITDSYTFLVALSEHTTFDKNANPFISQEFRKEIVHVLLVESGTTIFLVFLIKPLKKLGFILYLILFTCKIRLHFNKDQKTSPLF